MTDRVGEIEQLIEELEAEKAEILAKEEEARQKKAEDELFSMLPYRTKVYGHFDRWGFVEQVQDELPELEEKINEDLRSVGYEYSMLVEIYKTEEGILRVRVLDFEGVELVNPIDGF